MYEYRILSCDLTCATPFVSRELRLCGILDNIEFISFPSYDTEPKWEHYLLPTSGEPPPKPEPGPHPPPTGVTLLIFVMSSSLWWGSHPIGVPFPHPPWVERPNGWCRCLFRPSVAESQDGLMEGVMYVSSSLWGLPIFVVICRWHLVGGYEAGPLASLHGQSRARRCKVWGVVGTLEQVFLEEAYHTSKVPADQVFSFLFIYPPPPKKKNQKNRQSQQQKKKTVINGPECQKKKKCKLFRMAWNIEKYKFTLWELFVDHWPQVFIDGYFGVLSPHALFTSLPLKKARSSVGADRGSGLMRPLVYPSPHGCHPPPAINQVRAKVKPSPPQGYATPHEMCHPPTDAPFHWHTTPMKVLPPTDVPPPPPHWCATAHTDMPPAHRVVHGDGGSEAPWPLGPNF